MMIVEVELEKSPDCWGAYGPEINFIGADKENSKDDQIDLEDIDLMKLCSGPTT